MRIRRRAFLGIWLVTLLLGGMTPLARGNTLLPILFKPQVSPGTWGQSDNCGQACMNMVISYFQGVRPSAEGIMAIDEWLASSIWQIPLNDYNSGGTRPWKLVDVATQYAGMTGSYWDNKWSLKDVKDAIDQGLPVVCRVSAKYLTNKLYDYNYDHFIVAIGYDENYIICHDPAHIDGGVQYYSHYDFSRAHNKPFSSPEDWSRGQVVVVVPNGDVPPPPPPLVIPSADPPEAKVLAGVPVLDQMGLGYYGLSAPTAAAALMGFWVAEFPWLMDGALNGDIPDQSADAIDLILDLMPYVGYEPVAGLTEPENVGPGIERWAMEKGVFMDCRSTGRGGVTVEQMVSEIEAGRPFLLYSWDLRHHFVVVGYNPSDVGALKVHWGNDNSAPYVRWLEPWYFYSLQSDLTATFCQVTGWAPAKLQDADELAVDFGALGLYHYDGTTLKEIDERNPDSLISLGTTSAANFPSYGLYEYDGNTWTRLTKNDGQEEMCSSGNTLYVDFGAGVGLYKYDGSWTRLNSNSPERIWCVWKTLYVDFGDAIGLYSYDGSWTRLSKTDPQAFCAAGSVLYVDFGAGIGLYKYDRTWTRISRNPTEGMCTAGTTLYVDFGAGIGLYKYDGTWTRINKNATDGMYAISTTLYVDFGALGLYKYEEGTWTRINKQDPQRMTGYGGKLVVDFPSLGLYEYNGSWKRITPNNCEDMVAVQLY